MTAATACRVESHHERPHCSRQTQEDSSPVVRATGEGVALTANCTILAPASLKYLDGPCNSMAARENLRRNPSLRRQSLRSYTRIPGLVREHRADKANDDIRNSALTKGCVLKTRRIPRTLSALLLVELSIQGFYWIFATLAHAQNKSWCSRTNPDTRVLLPPA